MMYRVSPHPYRNDLHCREHTFNIFIKSSLLPHTMGVFKRLHYRSHNILLAVIKDYDSAFDTFTLIP